MRAKEFINEAHGIDKDSASVIDGGKIYKQMNNGYDLYRFGVSMAGQPDVKAPKGTIGDVPMVFPYSKGDEDIVRAAEKSQGKIGTRLTPKGANEPKGTNTVSPTAKPKRNKYGV
jgi:hypothetical protein